MLKLEIFLDKCKSIPQNLIDSIKNATNGAINIEEDFMFDCIDESNGNFVGSYLQMYYDHTELEDTDYAQTFERFPDINWYSVLSAMHYIEVTEKYNALIPFEKKGVMFVYAYNLSGISFEPPEVLEKNTLLEEKLSELYSLIINFADGVIEWKELEDTYKEVLKLRPQYPENEWYFEG